MMQANHTSPDLQVTDRPAICYVACEAQPCGVTKHFLAQPTPDFKLLKVRAFAKRLGETSSEVAGVALSAGGKAIVVLVDSHLASTYEEIETRLGAFGIDLDYRVTASKLGYRASARQVLWTRS